jgi:hypothetical protein
MTTSEPTRALSASQSEPWTLVLSLTAAAASLGYAIQMANGNLSPQALLWLTSTLVFGTVALLRPRGDFVERWDDRLPMGLLGLALAGNFYYLLTTSPGIYLRPNAQWGGFAWYLAAVGLSAFIAGAGLSKEPWLGPWRMPILLALHFFLGVWLIHTSPNPWIDVHVFQRDGVKELLRGIDPYTISYPDIYGASSPFYGPGMSINGRLLFGYPYPPLTLLMAIPGQLLGGDYRYSQLFAMTATGGLMAYARPGRLAKSAAALYLFNPRTFFVLEQGWTEPLIIFLLALSVYCVCRGFHRVVPYLLGLFCASKQYVIFTAPALLLLFPRGAAWRDMLRFGLKMALAGLAITLPFVLWNVPAFVRSVVTLQVYQPFRKEALDYLSWAFNSLPDLPSPSLKALAPIAGLGLSALSLWRTPRTALGYSLATSMAAVAFFAFSKQAFCNHYFFAVGGLCLALAVSPTVPPPSSRPNPWPM